MDHNTRLQHARVSPRQSKTIEHATIQAVKKRIDYRGLFGVSLISISKLRCIAANCALLGCTLILGSCNDNTGSVASNSQTSNVVKLSQVKYDIMENTPAQAVVLLKEPIYYTIDTAKLAIIADSLFKAKPGIVKNPQDSYRVWFYYRGDWKGNLYYAGKFWSFDYNAQALIPGKLDVTGITGNDKQDAIIADKKIVPKITSFDTASYLVKYNKLSKSEKQRLIKTQLNSDGELTVFIKRCEYLRDSAGIVTKEAGNYSHLVFKSFINVWGNISYPVTNNDYTYSATVTFEGVYDIYGTQVYFASSLNK